MIQADSYLITMENALMVFESIELSSTLISVPHDGLPSHAFSGLFEPRKLGSKLRDMNVWAVAKDILTQARINAVRGLMPRTFVDYNRSWPEGINYYPLSKNEAHTALDDPR